MFGFRRLIWCLALVSTGSVAHAADNLALIIVNKDYRNFSGAAGAFDVMHATQELQIAGFTTKIIRNLNFNGMTKLVPGIRADIQAADRVLVYVAGQVVSSNRESWLLTTDATKQDGLLAGTRGLPIQSIMDIMGDRAGGAVLMVGYPPPKTQLLSGLRTGFFPVEIPQGVSVFVGRASALALVLKNQLLVEGTTLKEVANQAPKDVEAFGFLSPMVSFLPNKPVSDVPVYDSPQDELEQLIWDNALATGSEQAMKTYLSRFPNGRYAAQASEQLAKFQRSPAEIARDIEVALGLNRDQFRDVQRNLSLLGFDTRGIDGIFGRGSRAALRGWQQSRGMPDSGYLTGNQIIVLDAAATVRAEELEEEARIRRAEQDRLDATYWRSTGRGNDEAGLRAYLKRYPDGLYSDIALERLDVFEAEIRRNAARAEGNAWDAAEGADTLAAYQGFLENYPDGTFSSIARDKIAKLNASQSNDAAKQEEQRVLNNPITRLLVERQLAAIGMKPGKIDGKYDETTRKAIRRFQRAAGLPVSGYVTQATIVRLLAAR